MNDKSDRTQEPKLAFFGTITASLSHELMNVLAIINEYGGLLEDMALMVSKGKEVKPERLAGIGEKVGSNVQRGRSLIKRLNRFAHLVDNPNATFDAKEAIEAIVGLTGRFAEFQKIELVTNFDEKTTMLTGDPFAFQHVVFLAMRKAMNELAESQTLTIALLSEQEGCAVEITGDFGDGTDNGELEALLTGLNARIEKQENKLKLYFV